METGDRWGVNSSNAKEQHAAHFVATLQYVRVQLVHTVPVVTSDNCPFQLVNAEHLNTSDAKILTTH